MLRNILSSSFSNSQSDIRKKHTTISPQIFLYILYLLLHPHASPLISKDYQNIPSFHIRIVMTNLPYTSMPQMVNSRVEDTESQRFLLEEWKGTERIMAMFSSLAQKQPSPPHIPALLCLASTLRTLVALERLE